VSQSHSLLFDGAADVIVEEGCDSDVDRDPKFLLEFLAQGRQPHVRRPVEFDEQIEIRSGSVLTSSHRTEDEGPSHTVLSKYSTHGRAMRVQELPDGSRVCPIEVLHGEMEALSGCREQPLERRKAGYGLAALVASQRRLGGAGSVSQFALREASLLTRASKQGRDVHDAIISGVISHSDVRHA
jgi:hypothetical protein